MRVWLLKSGEPLPIDPGQTRLHRVGTLSNFLAERGHEVTWWTSTFDHYHKRQRAEQDTAVQLPNGVRLMLLRGCGYRRNVSVARIREHRQIARTFSRLARTEPPPDVILCAFPTLEFADAATAYGKEFGVPVVVDIRDLWPDLLLEVVPAAFRPLARVVLAPMWKQARRACREATAICGTSAPFVEWGLRLAGRAATPLDRDFPFGYIAAPPSSSAVAEAAKSWDRLGIDRNREVFTACFFGGIGRQFDLETVIEAARILEARQMEIRFVICGAGEGLPALEAQARGIPSVLFPGWVDAPQIWTLMRRSHVGLAPYLDKSGFSSNYPNKTIEYLSAGLPVVSSLRGDFESFLTEHACGFTYPARDPAILADALAQLADDPRLLEEMSRSARDVFEKRFIGEHVYDEMIEYLEVVAGTHGTTRPGTVEAVRSSGRPH